MADRERDCIECGTGLRERRREGVTVEYCPSCGGVWLEPGELGTLLRDDRSETDPDDDSGVEAEGADAAATGADSQADRETEAGGDDGTGEREGDIANRHRTSPNRHRETRRLEDVHPGGIEDIEEASGELAAFKERLRRIFGRD